MLNYIDDLIQICNDANGDDPEAASKLFDRFNNVQTEIENTSSASAAFTQDMPFNKEGPPMRSLQENAASRLRNISIRAKKFEFFSNLNIEILEKCLTFQQIKK